VLVEGRFCVDHPFATVEFVNETVVPVGFVGDGNAFGTLLALLTSLNAKELPPTLL